MHTEMELYIGCVCIVFVAFNSNFAVLIFCLCMNIYMYIHMYPEPTYERDMGDAQATLKEVFTSITSISLMEGSPES